MKRRLSIDIELTDEELAALGFKIDEGRGFYNDPRRPRAKRTASSNPVVVAAFLRTKLAGIARDAVASCESHDAMVRANTRPALSTR